MFALPGGVFFTSKIEYPSFVSVVFPFVPRLITYVTCFSDYSRTSPVHKYLGKPLGESYAGTGFGGGRRFVHGGPQKDSSSPHTTSCHELLPYHYHIVSTTNDTMSLDLYPEIIHEGDLSPEAVGSGVDEICSEIHANRRSFRASFSNSSRIESSTFESGTSTASRTASNKMNAYPVEV